MSSANYKFAIKLPIKLFHENRQNFINTLAKKLSPEYKRPLFLMRSADMNFYHQNDIEDIGTPQEQNFYYLTGVKEFSCHLAIDLVNKESVLFCERMPSDLAMWMQIVTKQDMKKQYEIETRYNDQMQEYIKGVKPDKLIYVEGVNTDSGTKSNCIPKFEWLGSYESEKSTAYHVLEHCRAFKSGTEVIIMKQANKMAAEGHMVMMRQVKAGMLEDQLTAHFIFHCHKNYNQKLVSYPNISTGNVRSSMAHYFQNNFVLNNGDMLLNDSGIKLHQYCSDITTSFPLNGKFTNKQRQIYNIVLRANKQVFTHAKPGVLWSDMHKLAQRVILQGLQAIGIVKKEANVSELIEKRVGALFMHHGLGHLIGLNAHDVGGYIPDDKMCKPRIMEPGLKNLRHNRILQEGLMTTNEPGCYFVEPLLKGQVYPDIDRSAIDIDKAFEYRKEVAGVRIQDALLITEFGCESLSPACLPRTVQEIQAFMNLQK